MLVLVLLRLLDRLTGAAQTQFPTRTSTSQKDQPPTSGRVATLLGGTEGRVVRFNLDAVNTSTRYVDHGDINAVISSAEYPELSYLAGLCARNQLSVIRSGELHGG
jgi:hypothetical protein